MKAALFLALFLGIVGVPQVPANEDPFELSDEMKRFLDAKIDRSEIPLEQLNQLARIIFQDNALNFTYQPVTRGAIETFNNRGGNCVSFTFLFIAMARYLGLDARFHEVDVPPLFNQVGKLISVSGHTNAVVYIGPQVYLIDLFPSVNRIDIGSRVVPDARAYGQVRHR